MSAMKENFNPQQTQMIMFVLPNNKKERYDALKKFTYVDFAGECIFTFIAKVLQIALAVTSFLEILFWRKFILLFNYMYVSQSCKISEYKYNCRNLFLFVVNGLLKSW